MINDAVHATSTTSAGPAAYHLDANGNRVAGAVANYAPDRMWGAALTLIVIVMVLNLIARLHRARSTRSTGLKEASRWPSASTPRTSTSTTASSSPSATCHFTIAPRSGHRVHRAVRLRQVDRAAHAQPHARGDRRRQRRGRGPARRRGHLRRRASTRSTSGAPSAWCSSGRTRSRRCRSTTTSWPG